MTNEIRLTGKLVSQTTGNVDTTVYAEISVDRKDVEKALLAPEIGSEWRHRNGISYRVTHLANTENLNPKYPVTVVYQGANGNVWAKPLDNFLKSMELCSPF